MGTTDDAKFANTMGHFYQALAGQIGEFLHTHIKSLSDGQIGILSGDEERLISYANTFFSLSDNIAFENSASYFKGVGDATDAIGAAMKKIDDINKVIGIAAGCITLAAAIVSANGQGIVSSCQSILAAAKA
ncbi:MAG TPA: hypothetical protein VK563_06040 [Puia sp.]|nr:hypothetical protein [Puia sp.]